MNKHTRPVEKVDQRIHDAALMIASPEFQTLPRQDIKEALFAAGIDLLESELSQAIRRAAADRGSDTFRSLGSLTDGIIRRLK